MRTALSIFSSMAGIVLLMCETDSLTAFLISKAVAIVLLIIAAYCLAKADRHGELNNLKKHFDHEE